MLTNHPATFADFLDAFFGTGGEFAERSRETSRFTGALAQSLLAILAPILESTIPPGLMCVTEMKSVLVGSSRFGRMMLVAMRISARTYFFPRLRARVLRVRVHYGCVREFGYSAPAFQGRRWVCLCVGSRLSRFRFSRSICWWLVDSRRVSHALGTGAKNSDLVLAIHNQIMNPEHLHSQEGAHQVLADTFTQKNHRKRLRRRPRRVLRSLDVNAPDGTVQCSPHSRSVTVKYIAIPAALASVVEKQRRTKH